MSSTPTPRLATEKADFLPALVPVPFSQASTGGGRMAEKPSKLRYRELLKDPRWQKRRLEVLDRDSWKCRRCGNDEDTLHVHHRYYEFGVQPWEYPDSVLVTLCETCHRTETELSKKKSIAPRDSITVWVDGGRIAFICPDYLRADATAALVKIKQELHDAFSKICQRNDSCHT